MEINKQLNQLCPEIQATFKVKAHLKFLWFIN